MHNTRYNDTLMKQIVLFLSFLLFLPAQPLQAREMIDRIVAVINDEVITQSELDRNLAPVYQEYKQRFTGQAFMRKMNEARMRVLNQMIEDKLVLQEAKLKEIQVTGQEIDRKVDEIKRRFNTQDDFQRYLDAQGITLRKLRKRYQEMLAIQKLQNMAVRSRVTVSPLEARRYYDENGDKFITPEAYLVNSITIRKKAPDSGFNRNDDQARKKIQGLRKRIVEGKVPFEEVAKENSEDTHAAEGGDMGFISKGEFIPHLEEAIFALKPSEISSVLESEIGYHLFLLRERRDKTEKTFEESKKMIERMLYNKKMQTRFDEWVNRLRRDAYISIR